MTSLNYEPNYLKYAGMLMLLIYAFGLYVCGLVFSDELLISLAQVLLIVTSFNQVFEFNDSLNKIERTKAKKVQNYANK